MRPHYINPILKDLVSDLPCYQDVLVDRVRFAGKGEGVLVTKVIFTRKRVFNYQFLITLINVS